MSEFFNVSSTINNELGLLTSRKQESDQLISPRNRDDGYFSPNVTIFSQLENMRKIETQGITEQPFSTKSKDDQILLRDSNKKPKFIKKGFKIKKETSNSNMESLNYLNQSSYDQSPVRIKGLNASSSDKEELEVHQKEKQDIKRTSTLSNILLNDKVVTQDKTTLSNINQNQASTTQVFQANDDMQQNQLENKIKSNQDNTDQMQQDIQQNEFNINGNNKPNANDDNNNNINNNGTSNNNINNNNNNINNSSSQGNGNSNPTTSQKQINDSMEFQRKISNYSIKTQQYSNTPKMVKRNARNKKNLTCATTFQQSPPGGTPLKGSKNRIFPQINNSLQNSPYLGSSSIPQQSQREIQMIGHSKSMYNSLKKSQKFAGDSQQQLQTNQFLGQRDALSPTQQGGQIMFSNGTLNTQFDRKQTLIQPYATNTMNELLIHNSQSINFLKQWNIATRVKMINRFYQKVKNQTSQINFKYLQKRHFDLIDDSACYMFDESNNRFNQQQQTIITKIIQFFYILTIKITKLPVLSPNAQLIRYWRSFYTSLLLLQIFLIPFQISFSIIFNIGNYAYLLYYAPLIAYCFNIFVCLNTGYYEMGIEQLNRSKVFKNYKNQFLIDILVIISFILTNTLEEPFFNLLFYLKFYQLYSYFQDIVEYYKIHEKFSHVYTLAKLIFLILFVAHSCGCIFQFISIQEVNAGNQQTWLIQAGIYDNGIAERYLNSLYFSIITMITVGYGDIKPIADSEKMFTIFMALLGSVVFAYVVNTIGGIFQEIAQKEAEFIKKKYDLSIYMSTRQIKQDIQLRVMKFLDYKRMQEQDNPMRGEYILNQLSENLKEEIQKDFYGRILQSTKIFSSKFSQQFLNQVSLHFKEKVLGPGEIVFRQQSYGENDIYFILKGQVEIFLQSGQQTRHISYVKAGQFFGQGGFFSSSPRETCCKSTSTTHVIVLPQNKFIETLKDFPQDFETYSQIKDEMVLYNKKESMACLSCGKYNHSLNNCHFIHYKRNRDLLIARYTYSVPNERRAYKRYSKTFQTLKMNFNVRQDLKQLRQNVIQQTIEQHLEQQALDDSDRDEIIQNKVQLTNILSDKKFFQKAKKIKYDDEKNIIAYSDDEDVESQLGEITECSYYSSEDEESGSISENEGDEDDDGDDDSDIQEADIDQEESHTQNEIQADLIQQRKDEDALNSIQEEGEDGNDESKKNSQSRSSSVNIYREKLNQFMINLQQEGKVNQSDNFSKNNEQKLGISELSSSNSSSSSESNSSEQENQVLKLQVSGDESDQSVRLKSESSPNNAGEQSFQVREKSKTTIKQKKKKKNINKQSSSNKSIGNGDEIKLSRENSNNSSLKRDYDRQLSNDQSQKNINLKAKSKNNSSGQDSVNKLTDKGSASASSKKKKRDKQNITQSSKTNSNNQSNASSIQSNSQIIQQVLKGNILKSLNNSNQSSFINNTNSISFGNTNSLSFGNASNNNNKKKNQQNLNLQVLNSLAQLHKKEGILDETNKSNKQQNKFKLQDLNASQSKNNSVQQNSITFAAILQSQLPQLNLNFGNQELNSLYNDNFEDFNADQSQYNNFLMIQPQSNSSQNIEQEQSNYNTSNILKQDQSEMKNTPKKVTNKGFFQFGSQNYDEDDQNQQQSNKYKQHINTPKNQVKQDYNQYPLSFSNLNKIRSQSSASAPNQALDKLKKKSLLSREQSYRSLQSKLSRESKLLQVQEVEELIQNKKPIMNQQLGMSKFSAALSDWNATPILKHINGLMGINNTNNYDQESSISLGGFNTPGRSIKGLQQGNRNSIFNTTSYMDENNDDNQSIVSPYQNINSSNNSQQPQQLLQQSMQNKKSKFAPSQQGQQKRPSINQHLNENENPSENQALQSQNDSSLPNINIERIKKEQERIRRNSPFLMSKHPLSGILPPRNSIKIQNDKTSQKGRRSSIYSNFNQMAPLQNISNNNNQNNLQSNSNFQQNFNNEELIQKLKDLFLLRNLDDEKSNEALTKRGSTLYGSEQNFYMQHPLYDYNMFFLHDFDVMKEYEKYFKHNNFSEVLKKVKGKYKVIRRSQKTQMLKRKNLLVHTYSISGIGKID
ncbi:MFS transporter (macronuclear) [Tetrahymena thermophila SB210]|uniref:MFS transporter n=1 Tax=Tetrahymena thermophila (strain SB210) TaxID=312017 RepID=I7ML17_TETTS|nr:MFS transporter [Tetrahymena thermophila SB210]EAS00879.2 MFS transporter [Tetrahymena thermophila SB210]|eukprot:XP_001021125.2 MFS transporter [Tetrahymena thermophila SB210]